MVCTVLGNMERARKDCVVQGGDKSGGALTLAGDGGGMGKEERKEQVLKLLADSDLALTPYVMFRNLKMRGATFERRTLGNYLNELVDEGRVERLSGQGDTLYQITKKGRDSLND